MGSVLQSGKAAHKRIRYYYYYTNSACLLECQPTVVGVFQYASWDLAFHMIPMANVDLHFAKEQLMLFLREWYMHPNGQVCAGYISTVH